MHPQQQPGYQQPTVESRSKLISIAVLIVVAIVVAIFAGPGLVRAMVDNPNSRDTPAPIQSTAPALSAGEQEYVVMVRERPFFRSSDDATLVTVGRTACKGFDEEMKLPQLMRAGIKGAAGTAAPEDVRHLIDASVLYLCPEHKDKVSS